MKALTRLLRPTLCLFLGLIASAAEELVVDNRAPKPGEVEYRPKTDSTAALNPPSFIWLHDERAERYAVQWSPDAAFGDAVTVEDVRWNTYTHHSPLAPGRYHWRYRFTTDDGVRSAWSVSRAFTIGADATIFPLPTPEEQAARLPDAHPRLFMRPEDLPGLRRFARTEGADRFAALVGEADRVMAAGPTPEPEHLGSSRDKENQELIKYWWPNRVQTLRACEEAETLAFVYLLTGEERYGDAARRWILHLAKWDPDGPTNFRLNCEAAKPLLYRLPRAYDWAYAALSESDRAEVRRAMSRRIHDAWISWEVREGVGHLTRPYGSHANRIWHKIGEAGIAFHGEVPEAAMWLDYALNKFYACYPVWSDRDGGWHEGVAYWGGYMNKVVWWLQVADAALGIDGLRKPFFAHVGDFPLYVAPPRSPNMGFGDQSYRTPSSSWGGFLEYFIRAKSVQADGERAGYWRWWTEQWGMKGQGGILGFLYAAGLPPLPEPKAPVDLPASKVFHGIGVASLHSSLLDSRNDVHLLFKSSPFGTQSHGHNPHNSFQLNAYGEALLTTCVYRDLHGSKFHYQWAHSTRAHNAVLFEGEGQVKHTSAPHGRIVHQALSSEVDYVVGDATAAYGGRLLRFHRHVALVKGERPLVLIYDDLAARDAGKFQFLLHALEPFEIDPTQARLSVQVGQARLGVDYLSAMPMTFRQWDGYDPPPTRSFPNQWHVEATTSTEATELQVLTLLRPSRLGEEDVRAVERVEDGRSLGVRFSGRGGPAEIRFLRGDDEFAVTVER